MQAITHLQTFARLHCHSTACGMTRARNNNVCGITIKHVYDLMEKERQQQNANAVIYTFLSSKVEKIISRRARNLHTPRFSFSCCGFRTIFTSLCIRPLIHITSIENGFVLPVGNTMEALVDFTYILCNSTTKRIEI